MGNIYSFEKNNKTEDISSKTNKDELNQADFTSMVDDIAIDYIFTQNTIDLIKISDKEYYDNMFILTQEILKKRLSSLELGFLNERVLNGITEKVYLQDKKKMTNLIPKNDKIKKKLLNNVSMYYMKIILIFSAIVSTSDPLYYYIDSENNKKEFYLKDIDKYKDLPSDIKPKISHFTNPFNLCKKRLDILSHNLVIGDNTITINPGAKLCDDGKKTLNQEIGISELDALYCDIFDNNTKKWSKKSPKMEKQYKKDLILFYQIFTGNKFKPENIKSFSQIELIDFKTLDKCNKDNFKNNITLSKDNKMVIQYLNKIKKIKEYTESYKSQMMQILQQLFLYSEEDKKYKLHPQLTLKQVQKMEIDTREIILKLYTTCEKYFLQAILIFKEIYQEQNMNVNTNRSYNLEGSLVYPETILPNKQMNETSTFDDDDDNNPENDIETQTNEFTETNAPPEEPQTMNTTTNAPPEETQTMFTATNAPPEEPQTMNPTTNSPPEEPQTMNTTTNAPPEETQTMNTTTNAPPEEPQTMFTATNETAKKYTNITPANVQPEDVLEPSEMPNTITNIQTVNAPPTNIPKPINAPPANAQTVNATPTNIPKPINALPTNIPKPIIAQPALNLMPSIGATNETRVEGM